MARHHRGPRPAAARELRIVDADGAVLPPARPARSACAARCICHGYLDPTRNAEAFDADGYFRTGDLGSVDEHGNLTVSGRLKDVIIRKGENIAAKDVEDVLYAHPDVADVAVIGLPDPERGERACAVVVLRDGVDPSAFDLDDDRRALPRRRPVGAEDPRAARDRRLAPPQRQRQDPQVPTPGDVPLMSSFRALVLDQVDDAQTVAIQDLDDDRLPDGDVTVDVEWSSLNYKDGMILGGIGRLVRNFPHVPGVDFAGTVTASDSAAFFPGDRVVLTGFRVGEAWWGGYSQRARVSRNGS